MSCILFTSVYKKKTTNYFLSFFRSANGWRTRRHFAWWIWFSCSVLASPESSWKIPWKWRPINCISPSCCIAIFVRGTTKRGRGLSSLRAFGWCRIVGNCINWPRCDAPWPEKSVKVNQVQRALPPSLGVVGQSRQSSSFSGGNLIKSSWCFNSKSWNPQTATMVSPIQLSYIFKWILEILKLLSAPCPGSSILYFWPNLTSLLKLTLFYCNVILLHNFL